MRSRVKQVAVIYPSIGMPHLARGVVDYAKQQGNWSVYFDRDIESPSLQRLAGWPGHGVIAEVRTASEAQRAKLLGLPVVNVSGRLRKCGLPRVTVDQTAIGALGLYVSNESVTQFQPMNINFGIMPPLDHRVKGKRNKNAELSQRSLAIIEQLKQEVLNYEDHH